MTLHCSGRSSVRPVRRLQAAKDQQDASQDLIYLAEQALDLAERACAVEQAGKRAEKIAQQAASWYRGDIQVDRRKVDDQPEQVEVDRPDVQIEDGATCFGASTPTAPA